MIRIDGTAPAVEVDDREVSVTDWLRRMKLRGADEALNELRDDLLRQRWMEQRGLDVPEERLYEALTILRQSLELYLEEELLAWMERNGLDEDGLIEFLMSDLRADAIRESFTRAQVEQHYAENRLRYETAELYQIVTREEGEARELLLQAVEDGVPFPLLALEYSIDESSRAACGYIGARKREHLTPDWEAAVFGAQPGQIVGPLEGELGFYLVKVAGKRQPILDAELERQIRDELYTAGLENLRERTPVNYPIWNLLKRVEE